MRICTIWCRAATLCQVQILFTQKAKIIKTQTNFWHKTENLDFYLMQLIPGLQMKKPFDLFMDGSDATVTKFLIHVRSFCTSWFWHNITRWTTRIFIMFSTHVVPNFMSKSHNRIRGTRFDLGTKKQIWKYLRPKIRGKGSSWGSLEETVLYVMKQEERLDRKRISKIRKVPEK